MLNRAGAGAAGRMGVPLRKVAVVGRGGIGPPPPISQRPEVGCLIWVRLFWSDVSELTSSGLKG